MRGNKLLKFIDYYIGIPLVFLLSLLLRGKRKVDVASLHPMRILVVKLVALGDAILLVPSLRALRRRFPKSEIVFLGTPLTENIMKQFPEYIDRIISLDVIKLAKNPAYGFGILKEMRTAHFDLSIDFEQWTRFTPLLLAFAGIPVRVGFRTKEQHHHYLYTHTLTRNSHQHEVDNFLGVVELFSKRTELRSLELKVDPELLTGVRQWLKEKGWRQEQTLIIVHPGCGSHGFPREWSPARYRSVMEEVSIQYKAFFIVSGMRNEEQVMDEIGAVEGSIVEQYFIPSTDNFIALLSLANLVISGNTGAMHLAAALQVPQVALHGPTNAELWGPVNPKAIVIKSSCPECPCLDLGFEYHRIDGFCMNQISVEEVTQACFKLLKTPL